MRHHSEDHAHSAAQRTRASDDKPRRFARGTRELERLPEEPAAVSEQEVAHIVHDLKSPLSTIALESTLLEAVDVDPAVVRNAAARIARNVEYIDRMVHDLLDLCAIDAGKLALRRTPTELRALLEGVVMRVVPTTESRRVFVVAPKPVTIAADAFRIERVIANLLQNALRYAPADTAIVVRLDIGDARVTVSVIDAGPGIEPREREAVFQKYLRGRGASGAGSGLGLYISKCIVEAHGGRIGVEPLRGGSRFFFELPR